MQEYSVTIRLDEGQAEMLDRVTGIYNRIVHPDDGKVVQPGELLQLMLNAGSGTIMGMLNNLDQWMSRCCG